MHLWTSICLLVIGLSYTSGQIFTTTGQRCVLPFIYLGQTYYTCTTVNNNGVLWCSLSDNYDRDKQYGICANFFETYSGRPCYLPNWTFRGKVYSGCTTDVIGVPWCGTKSNVPEDFGPSVGSWGYCKVPAPPTRPPTPPPPPAACDVITTAGTAFEGSKCVFPFNYNGVTYKSCTGANSKGAWCSITSNFSDRWGYCIYKRAIIPASNGRNCIFPFRYRGTFYYHCVTFTNNFVPWCATTNDYDRDQQWGNCQLPQCNAVTGG